MSTTVSFSGAFPSFQTGKQALNTKYVETLTKLSVHKCSITLKQMYKDEQTWKAKHLNCTQWIHDDQFIANKVEIISDKKQKPSLTRAPFGPIFPRGPGKPYKNTNDAICHACKLDQ